MNTPVHPIDDDYPLAAGSEPGTVPVQHEPATTAAHLTSLAAAPQPPAPTLPAPPTPAPPTATPRPARLALVPIIVGLIGLVAVSGIILDLTQGQAAGTLGLGWLGIGLFVLFRLALLWQHKLNDTPLVSPRTGP
ncbi:MAG: hypothetical protein KBB39_15550 [Phycicoccus sp.]|nr:hypothetical protein [Phycicoccus sp.]